MIRPGYMRPVRRPLAIVRRKFSPPPNLLELLNGKTDSSGATTIGGHPILPAVQHISTSQFEDVYYDDRAGTLAAYGISLRRRSGAWQINRHPHAPETLNPHVGTVHDLSRIIKVLEHAAPAVQLCLGGAKGLLETARFITARNTWDAQLQDNDHGTGADAISASKSGPNVCRIYRDAMDFGHVLGEVRITLDLDAGEDTEGAMVGLGAEMVQKRQTEYQEARLEAFMKKHDALFNPHDEPIGKLVAYFTAKGK